MGVHGYVHCLINKQGQNLYILNLRELSGKNKLKKTAQAERVSAGEN
jgi:hypothetical protein